MPKNKVRALGWVGGKSAFGAHKTGKWIADQLPPVGTTYTYVEPFSGMLGVLLQRPRHRREIVNDLDGDLINWWRAVRDYPRELGDRLDWSPGWSAALFGEAVDVINEAWDVRLFSAEECVTHAWYFTLAVHWVRGNMIGRVRSAGEAAVRRRKQGHHQQDTAQYAPFQPSDDGIKRWVETRWEKDENRADDGISRERETRQERFTRTARSHNRDADVNMKRLAWLPDDREIDQSDGIRRYRDQRFAWGKKTGGGFPYRKPKTGEGRSGEMSPPRSEHILKLRERVKDVELEIRSAAWMADYYKGNPNITWYFDPPYQIAEEKGLYTFNNLPITDWIPLLRDIKGLVAVSGYGQEWDGLDWRRHEHKTHASVGAQNDRERPEKVEVLWTNFNPAKFRAQPELFGG